MNSASKKPKNESPGPVSWFSLLKKRLQGRTDTEHETMLNGLIFYCLINVYAAVLDYAHISDHKLLPEIGLYSLMFGMLTLLAFFHMLANPAECPPRKIAVLTLYILCITYAIHLGGELFLWLYPMLLWAVLGYGFRFGNRYLFSGAAISVAAFTVLINFSPFWMRYPALSWGCVAGLIILPAYVSVLIRKLSEAKRAAEESNRAKSAFLASISHELRTPLTAIIGLSDLMQSTRLTREQADMTETIGESGRSLLSLINAILDLSRLEVGMMPRKAQTVDLFRLVHKVMAMIEVPARGKDLRVSLHIQPGVPRFVETYLKHIEDSLVNLASNAVKFTEKGSVLICLTMVEGGADPSRLRVEVHDTGIGVAKDVQSRIFERFTQADETIIDKFGGTGLGLATVKQMIEDIGGQVGVDSEPGKGSVFWFEINAPVADALSENDWRLEPVILVTDDMKIIHEFEHLEIAVSVYGELAAAADHCDRLTLEHEGCPAVFIDVRACGSDLASVARAFADRVSVRKFKLVAILDSAMAEIADVPKDAFATLIGRPLAAGAVANALTIVAGARSALMAGAGATVDGLRQRAYSVLVADDNKVNRTVISKILTRAGHKVAVAENGQIAIEMMQDGDFDVALLDLNMPVMSGIEAAQLYAFAALGGPKIPIAALTADATPEAERRCLDAGMVACLTKPIEASVLLAAIDEIVRKHGPAQDIAADRASQASAYGAMSAIVAEDDPAPDEPVDEAALKDLLDLGGIEFVQEVVEHFIIETREIVSKLEIAVGAQDYLAFREEVHALRSGAANVGARKVFKLCLEWREIGPQDIVVKGDLYLRELGDAALECTDFLTAYCRRVAMSQLGGDLPEAERKPPSDGQDIRKAS